MLSVPKNCEGKSTMAAEHGSTLRIVLVGHTGAGKSSSGNTILARKAFKAECCSNAVTKVCEKKKGKVENRDVLVVDTPGLKDAEMTQEELKSEIEKCIEMCAPGPHAFLLVIKIDRFTEEQQAVVKWIQENFGEGALKHTIVLFTKKDDLEGKSVEKFIFENPSLQKVVHNCGSRYHAFNNRGGSPRQVTELFIKIEKMLKHNNTEYYTKDMYKRTQKINDQREQETKTNLEIKENQYKKHIERELLKNMKEWVGEMKVEPMEAAVAGGAYLGVIGVGVGVGVGHKAGLSGAFTGGAIGGITGGVVGGVLGYKYGPKVVDYFEDAVIVALNERYVDSAEKDKTV